jgi:hypothetical protein
MQPSTTNARRLLYVVLGALFVLALLVKWCNTPRRDSSEKPLPRKEEKALERKMAQAVHRADSLQAVADSLVSSSRIVYALGVDAGKEAAALRLETHSKPSTHVQAPTPASTKHLQQYFDEY